MKTPTAYCKILKTQKWAKVPLANIQEVNSNNRLSPFDEATYKKMNKYVIKNAKNNKFSVVCVVEFAGKSIFLLSDHKLAQVRFLCCIPLHLFIGDTAGESM